MSYMFLLNRRRYKNLVTNGNFANGTAGWMANGSVLSVNANIMSVTGNGTFQDVNIYQNTSIPFVAGKKYYIRAKIKVTNASCANAVIHAYTLFLGSFVFAIAAKVNPVQNTEYVLSNVYTMATNIGNLCIALRHYYADAATAAGKVMEVQNVIAIDLTATFGPGNEPTLEWCDANIPQNIIWT